MQPQKSREAVPMKVAAKAIGETWGNLPPVIKGAFCPPISASENDRLKWINAFLDSSAQSMKSSPNYQRAVQAVQELSFGGEEKAPAGRISKTDVNRTKRQIDKIVATLSDVSPEWKYGSHDKVIDAPVTVISNLFSALWNHPMTNVRDTLVQLFQYAVTSEAYLGTYWEQDMFSDLRGDIGLTFKAYAVDDVLHSALGKDKDLQKAHVVAICNEMPLTMAAMLYPNHARYFSGTHSQGSWFRKVASEIKNALMPAFQAAEADREFYGKRSGAYLESQMEGIASTEQTEEIFDIYILDPAVNRSGFKIGMGRPGTCEYYEVPSVGQEIPINMLDSYGVQKTRKALEGDCLIYKYRRRIICTRTHIISDAASPWLHGKVPIVRVALNDTPWDKVANSMAMEGNSLNRTIESLYRGIQDIIELRMQPGLKLPDSLAQKTAEAIDPRIPNRHMRVSQFGGQNIETILPWQNLSLNGQEMNFIKMLEGTSDYIIGEPEMRSLAQAQQIPSAEAIDRFMQVSGPLATFISRNVESSLLRLGELVKFLLIQYATAPMRLTLQGRAGLTPQDFDFNPADLIPSSTDSERLAFPLQSERIKNFASKIYFSITANSAYRITDTQRQMMIFQLHRDGRFPIGPWTVAKAFGIDIGKPPTEAITEVDQWKAWQAIQAEFTVNLQAQAQLIMAQAQAQAQVNAQRVIQSAQIQDSMSGMGQLAQMMGGGMDPSQAPDGSTGGGGGTGNPEGRPPSGQKPPHLEQKDGGARTTVSES